MILQATNDLKFDDLIQTLKSQFSSYSVYTLGSIPQKSLIVRKSAIVGAQISIRQNKLIIDACCPNIFISGLIGFLGVIFPPYENFEMEITDYLKKKYT